MSGSHKRYRIDYENECLVNIKFTDMLGLHIVELKKSQIMFWDNLIQRGQVPEGNADRLILRAGLYEYQLSEAIHDLSPRFGWMRAGNRRDALPQRL